VLLARLGSKHFSKQIDKNVLNFVLIDEVDTFSHAIPTDLSVKMLSNKVWHFFPSTLSSSLVSSSAVAKQFLKITIKQHRNITDMNKR